MATEKLCLESGHGVRILSSSGSDESGQQFRLETEELARLAARGGLGARPAVLVSVAGACRGGKSFLLDYMLRYLYAQMNRASAADWLGHEDEPLRGFSWRGGSRRDTTGLVLWSQPIPVTLPDGQEVAVLLMDTQGAFDEQSSLRDCSLLFALSSLLASVQIYNVSQQLKEDDLQHLQLFAEYAAAGSGGLASLQLLLRDWSAPYEFPYGEAGGELYLKEKLQVKEEQPMEARELRRRLAAALGGARCCLLPHPGLSATRDSDFQGSLAELEPEFKLALRELVPSLLAPARLRVKEVAGRPLLLRDLPLLLQTYLDEFTTKVPSPLSALSARLSAIATATRAPLQALAERAQDLKGLDDLEKELDEMVDQYVDLNDSRMELAMSKAKDSFENAVRDLDCEDLCLHPLDLDAAITEARDAALANFDCDEATSEDPDMVQLFKYLEERSSAVLPRLSAVNAANNAAALEAACAELRALPYSCAHADDVISAHAAAARAAAATFLSRRNKDSAHEHDPYITQLEEATQESLDIHRRENDINNNRAKDEALLIYDTSITLTGGCWRPDLLAAKNMEVQEQILEAFYSAREGENSRKRDNFVVEIESVLSTRYDLLYYKNQMMNSSAVDEIYRKFFQTMNGNCSGFRVGDAALQGMLDTAFTEGRNEFRAKRIPGQTRLDDPNDEYLQLLCRKMKDDFAYFYRKNSDNPTEWDYVRKGLELAAAALVVLTAMNARR